jgi:hypothetical protein
LARFNSEVLAGDIGHRARFDQNTVIFSVRDFAGQQMSQIKPRRWRC